MVGCGTFRLAPGQHFPMTGPCMGHNTFFSVKVDMWFSPLKMKTGYGQLTLPCHDIKL